MADLSDATKLRIAEEVFKRRMLLASGETGYDGIPLNYNNDLVVRTPSL